MSEPTAPVEATVVPDQPIAPEVNTTPVVGRDDVEPESRPTAIPPGHSSYTGAPYSDNPTPLPAAEEEPAPKLSQPL